MIDHFGINCADYAKSQEFYDRVLAVLDGNNVEAVFHAAQPGVQAPSNSA